MSEPSEPTAERRPLRLPTEMPRPAGARDSRALGLGVSIIVHGLIILALVLPLMFSPTVRSAIARGAGGAGPAGGGGGRGGSRGVMGDRERLRFVRVTPEVPAPPQAEEVKPALVPPPQPQPKPEPVVPPQNDPTPEPEAEQPSTATGAGTGNEGTGGAGPGSGGGVGSGIGTGRGSALGPGTGGGADSVYPPTMVETFLPPYPIPSKIRPFVLVASFEVDSTGKILALEFTESRDRSYNRKLRETLARIRFRPGVRADGTPIRTRYELRYDM